MLPFECRNGRSIVYLAPHHITGIKGHVMSDTNGGEEEDHCKVWTVDSSEPWEVEGKASDVAKIVRLALA